MDVRMGSSPPDLSPAGHRLSIGYCRPSPLLPVHAQNIVWVFGEYLLADRVKTRGLLHIDRVVDDASAAGRVAAIDPEEFGGDVVLFEDLAEDLVALLHAASLYGQINYPEELLLLGRPE